MAYFCADISMRPDVKFSKSQNHVIDAVCKNNTCCLFTDFKPKSQVGVMKIMSQFHYCYK